MLSCCRWPTTIYKLLLASLLYIMSKGSYLPPIGLQRIGVVVVVGRSVGRRLVGSSSSGSYNRLLTLRVRDYDLKPAYRLASLPLVNREPSAAESYTVSSVT